MKDRPGGPPGAASADEPVGPTQLRQCGDARRLIPPLLERAGCDRDNIFSEQVSSIEHRAQLDAAIRALRKGDILVVTKLDRFARSLEHAIGLERKIADKGASLMVLDPSIDTSQPIGRLMFNMIGAVAQFEREIMLERQREGIARAQREDRYKGRQPTARRKSDQVLNLAAQGLEKIAIAQTLGISRASVYRILAATKQAAAAA